MNEQEALRKLVAAHKAYMDTPVGSTEERIALDNIHATCDEISNAGLGEILTLYEFIVFLAAPGNSSRLN